MIPHWYTFEVKSIPIHILWGLKRVPHSSRTSVYSYIMGVTLCAYTCFTISVPNDVCAECPIHSSGFGYVGHPEDCDMFIICAKKGTSKIVYSVEKCPLHTFWNSKALACDNLFNVLCPNGKCKSLVIRVCVSVTKTYFIWHFSTVTSYSSSRWKDK